MTCQQSRLLAPPSGTHDIQQAEELMQECQVQAWLCLGWRHLREVPIAESSYSRRLEKEPTMCIEGCRLSWVNLYFGCRVLVRDEDGSRAIFALESGITAKQCLSLCFLCLEIGIPAITTIETEDYRYEKRDESDQASRSRGMCEAEEDMLSIAMI